MSTCLQRKRGGDRDTGGQVGQSGSTLEVTEVTRPVTSGGSRRQRVSVGTLSSVHSGLFLKRTAAPLICTEQNKPDRK